MWRGNRFGELGAARAREPGLAASEARMAERSRHAVSAGQDARSERPAPGHGQPRAARYARSPSLTRLGFLAERTTGDRAWAAPSGALRSVPIAYAIGLPGRANVRRPGMGSRERRVTHDPHRLRDWASWRSERPATGHGQPRAARYARSPSLTRLGFLTQQTTGDRAWAAPSGALRSVPIAYAIGLPGAERTTGSRAWAAASGGPRSVPIAYAIGLPDTEAWS